VQRRSRAPEAVEALWVEERHGPALQVMLPEGYYLVDPVRLRAGDGTVYLLANNGRLLPTDWHLLPEDVELALKMLGATRGPSRLNGLEDDEEEYPRTQERILGPGLGGLLEDAEERRKKASCSGGSLPEYRLALEQSRCVKGAPTGERLATPTAVGDFLSKNFGCQPQEQFLALGLNPRSELLGVLDVGTGGIDSAAIDPRVLFAGLVLMGASATILCHVHPSGDPTASVQDVQLTRQLKQSAEVLAIRLLDHIVIAPGGRIYSMQQAGTLP
jgi:hypothetical protein